MGQISQPAGAKGGPVVAQGEPAWLHKCSLLLGIFCLLGIAAGAWVSAESWPLPGVDAAHSTTLGPAIVAAPIHLLLGVLIAVLGAATGIGALKSGDRAVRLIGWWPLALTVAAAGLVSPSAFRAAHGAVTLLHTLCAQLVLASTAAVWVMTSHRGAEPEHIEDTWKPSLRTLSWLVPGLVLLQILLGASFRRDYINVLWHVLNALLVLMLNIVVGVCLLKQFPTHKALRPAALGLIIVTAIQVLLGFTAFIILLMSSAITYPLAIVGSIHAFTGSLVMAAAAIVAVQIRRSIATNRFATK